MMLKLQKYDLVVSCRADKLTFTAHAQSRTMGPLQQPEQTSEMKVQAYVDLRVRSPACGIPYYTIRLWMVCSLVAYRMKDVLYNIFSIVEDLFTGPDKSDV